MSTCVNKSNFQLLSSSIKVEEEAPKVTAIEKKQGIVSILGSDCETTAKAASLRRTLSADMSSKKWPSQNGFFSSFSPMKKIASSEELAISAADHSSSSSSFSSEGEEEYYDEELIKRPGQDDVWRSIQSQKEKKEQQPDFMSWGSILAPKNEDSSTFPPPYIHPLVRRSGSSLSEKSLEICTESLGSETGSDGFSSYPPSEGDIDEEKDNDQQPQQQLSRSYEDVRVVKYNYSISSKMGPLSFPPPLPSLAREDRTSVQMHSYRENGRLVLEAVSIPPQNYFQAQREDGRLRLTFINSPPSQEEEIQEFDEQVFDNFEEIEENEANFDDEEEEDEDIEEDVKYLEKEKGIREVEFVMDVHKPTFMMKRLMGLDKKNLAWAATRFNKAVNLIEVEDVEDDELITPPLTQSLPIVPPPPPLPRPVARLISAPPATTTAAASFNAYEYFWKEKPTMTSIIKPMSTEQCNQLPLKNNQNNKVILASNLKLLKGNDKQQNLVVMRGNRADQYLVPLLWTCKESRARSLLLWEPYRIATS
ncbi:hypothetical protein ACH5RR_021250 [Cinchona calisaya]|uniref:FAF domain-containing protein n=1 Tax=Cinchona calisaya TaxID=153742 RepID=A0ABD2ZGR6_9GENT